MNPSTRRRYSQRVKVNALHTVVIKVLDADGKPIKAVLDTVGIIHPGVDCYLEDCPEVEDRRSRIGQH